MELKERKDLLTGEVFTPKRINQRFATPSNRIKYYNDKANQMRYDLARINKPLLKNLKILNELMINKSEAKFHKQFLIGKGLAFGLHTHYEKYDGKIEIAIYDYIIIQLENQEIKIIKK